MVLAIAVTPRGEQPQISGVRHTKLSPLPTEMTNGMTNPLDARAVIS